MLRPLSAYRRLAADAAPVHPLDALRRPALAALVVGSAISIGATGRATAPLVVSTTICWSFVVLWQLVAAAVIARSSSTALTMSQRLDLLFTGQAPWSLWLLIAAGWSRVVPQHTDLYALLSTSAIPGVWTLLIVYGFCRTVLQLTARVALRRAVLHQALIWTFAFFYVTWAVALWSRMRWFG